MIYAKISNVGRTVFLFFAALVFASCHSTKLIELNAPNYEVVASGSKKKPALLLFADPSFQRMDSLVKELTTEYYVLTATKRFDSDIERLNSDHPTTRSEEGLQVYEQLQEPYNITRLGAVGLTVPSLSNWVQAVRPEVVELFPYYDGSLQDHIKAAIGTGTPLLGDTLVSPVHFYSLLETFPAPAGVYHGYSYRYLQAIWTIDPKTQLQALGPQLKISVLD